MSNIIPPTTCLTDCQAPHDWEDSGFYCSVPIGAVVFPSPSGQPVTISVELVRDVPGDGTVKPIKVAIEGDFEVPLPPAASAELGWLLITANDRARRGPN